VCGSPAPPPSTFTPTNRHLHTERRARRYPSRTPEAAQTIEARGAEGARAALQVYLIKKPTPTPTPSRPQQIQPTEKKVFAGSDARAPLDPLRWSASAELYALDELRGARVRGDDFRRRLVISRERGPLRRVLDDGPVRGDAVLDGVEEFEERVGRLRRHGDRLALALDDGL
jgi:hypothetical protein